MKKKRKLTTKQKVINRIHRRLKTLEKQGVSLRIKPTKKNIDEILKANLRGQKVTKDNAKILADDFVNSAQVVDKTKAKQIKTHLGFKRISDVQGMSGQELHDTIKKLYDSGYDDDADAIVSSLEAYGYDDEDLEKAEQTAETVMEIFA